MKKIIDCSVVKVFVISSQKNWSMVYILQFLKNTIRQKDLPYSFLFYIQNEFI